MVIILLRNRENFASVLKTLFLRTFMLEEVEVGNSRGGEF